MVLVVDDEPQMTEIISFALSTEGMETVVAHSGAAAWKAFETTQFDLVILDLMLPDVTGYQICQRIRSTSNTPVIMLTALGQTEKRIAGFEFGADDYLAKPFSPRELVLRAKAIIRRTGHSEKASHTVSAGSLTFVDGASKAYFNSRRLDLTGTEAQLLYVLVHHAGNVVSVRELLNEVWHTTATQGGHNMVKSTVYRVRKKLAKAGMDSDCVQSVRGRGYVFLEQS